MRKLGLGLIVFSFLPWGVVALLPVLPMPVGQKALLVPVLAVLAEVAFWLGLLLVGKEAAAKYRRYFSPSYVWKRLSGLIGKQPGYREEALTVAVRASCDRDSPAGAG